MFLHWKNLLQLDDPMDLFDSILLNCHSQRFLKNLSQKDYKEHLRKWRSSINKDLINCQLDVLINHETIDRNKLQKINIPTYFITAKHDRICDSQEIDTLKKIIPSFISQHSFNNGHSVYIENPLILANTLSEILYED